MILRAYEPADRSSVRRIACETANRGESADAIFPDREIVADLLTRYYTDAEPQSAWVADFEGRVVGYLTGCLDSRRYWRMMHWRVGPSAVLRAIARGACYRRETWRFVRAMMGTWRRGGFNRYVPLDEYPAHLHVNVQHGFRGQRVGTQLVERCIAQVREAGLRGMHLAVRDDNQPARRLFERLGFRELSRYPVLIPTAHAYQLHQTVIYGKRV